MPPGRSFSVVPNSPITQARVTHPVTPEEKPPCLEEVITFCVRLEYVFPRNWCATGTMTVMTGVMRWTAHVQTISFCVRPAAVSRLISCVMDMMTVVISAMSKTVCVTMLKSIAVEKGAVFPENGFVTAITTAWTKAMS